MSDRYRFQVTLHAQPHVGVASAMCEIAGQPWPRLLVSAEALRLPLDVTFEQAVEALEQLPRMFCEPDGSFVWVSAHADTPAWQVDGMLYDRDNRLLYVDLKGECPAGSFDMLLRCFGAPPKCVMFQLVRQAVFLDEATFRRYASGEGGGMRDEG